MPLTPSRLALARKRKGLTLTRLAKLSGVSSRSLSDYENGRTTPTPQTVEALAAALEVRLGFLYASELEDIPVDRVSFRALTKMTASQRDSALAAARIAVLINEWVERRFKLPPPDLPTLTGQRPETAARDLRGIWGLGESPISNIVHLLEAHGVRVFSLPHSCREIDAFAFFWCRQPFVLLNTTKSGERGRFDGSHELGHLVLHSEYEIPHGREAERDADRFASAFLMPPAAVRAKRLHNASVDRILLTKKQWGVSAMALNYRLNELGMLTEWGHRANASNLSRMGYRRGEPEGIPRESSQLLSKVFRQLGPGRTTIADLAGDLDLTIDELNHYVFGLVTTAIRGGGQTTPQRTDLRVVN
ncbi:XRE family transcriptional regulator [Actinomadura litoris]|uniref:XRE family transcriptional regulator n=1 Tax=Actinomadura litoris TaxID=2678616 RepID=UPI001FA81211|nr:XRE family transcriptional regulator [Actinomadura litoris]